MLSELRKIRTILTPAERRKSSGMLLLVILMALAETMGVLSVMPFLSVLARPEIMHEARLLVRLQALLGTADARQFTLVLGFVSIAAVVLSSAFKTITLHLVNRFVYMLRHSRSTRLLSRYIRQPYEFFLTRNPAELSKNVLSEADQLTFNLLQPLSMLIAHGVVVFAMVILIVVYDPWMAVGILATVAALYASIYLLVRGRLARIGAARVAADQGRYQASSEALGGIKDVLVTGSAEHWLQRYRTDSREFSRHMATADTLSTSPLYIVEALGFTGLIIIALILLTRDQGLANVLPALGLYGFSAYRMLPAAQIMYRGIARLRYSGATLDKVHQDLLLADQSTSAAGPPLAPRQAIRLRHVSYAYPSAPDRPILEDFSLDIPVNSSLGIAGPSGAGKSTLMDILLGLLPPASGELLIDDTPVTRANVKDWQQAIGYVPQHIYLADASVAENIAFGVPRDRIDMGAVARAARLAQIDEFIHSELVDGYATCVGDRGIRLSGGQRQRIGIARALYRDPPILLMDEATSALDVLTEEAFNTAIRALTGRKTIVVIAHKPSSLASCDTILTIDNVRS